VDLYIHIYMFIYLIPLQKVIYYYKPPLKERINWRVKEEEVDLESLYTLDIGTATCTRPNTEITGPISLCSNWQHQLVGACRIMLQL